jgi:hypothetical protein
MSDPMKVLSEALEAFTRRAQSGTRALPKGLVREPASEPGWEVVKGPCFVTGEQYQVLVMTDGLDAFLARTHAIDAFPYLNAGDREFLISGTSPKGWAQAIGEPE